MEKTAEIRNHEELLLQAIKSNNIEVLDQLLHDDLLFLNPAGEVITKSMDLANYGSGQVVIDAIESYEQSVRLVDNTAIVAVKIKLKGKYMEYVLDETFQYLRIWIDHGGRWQIIGGSCAKLDTTV